MFAESLTHYIARGKWQTLFICEESLQAEFLFNQMWFNWSRGVRMDQQTAFNEWDSF